MSGQPKPVEPRVGRRVFIDASAIVSGDVAIGDCSSVWPHAVLRGDLARITLGRYTNIQELSLVHVDRGSPCRIGSYVTAGHKVTLHGCTVADEVLIGMGTIILTGAQVGRRVVIGAGSLVPENKVLDPGFLYFGSPVRQIRELTAKEKAYNRYWAKEYARLAGRHLRGLYGRFGLVTGSGGENA